MGASNLRFRVYAGTVACVAGLGFAVSWMYGPRVTLDSTMLTLVIAVLVSEVLAVDLPDGGSLSLTYPLSVCAIVLLGPTAAAVLATVSMVPALLSTPRMSPSRLLGNLGQVVLAVLVPGWLYLALNGPLLSKGALAAGALWSLLPALLVAGTAGVFVNAALFVTGYGIMHQVPARRVWRLAVSWALAPQLVLGLLGLAIAQVMATSYGPLGFALFVVPLVVARQTHSRYLSLRETYADTVRSLVAALEAKDPYTKGHSVRVAGFAVAIAEAMCLDERETQNIEYAALLHDLGKIGISRSVLSKQGKLSPEEYERVREHPAIAARILESVPFLSGVLPAVRDHHERLDGRGYGRGVKAGDLSQAARILAVADSFDAMTADRPYRSALTMDAAIAELRSHSGTQFDSAIVEAFLVVLPSLEAGAEMLVPTLDGGATVAEA